MQNQDDLAIAKVKMNYVHWEQSLVEQLNMSSQHHLTTGGFREDIWMSMFEQMVPRKFSIARSVFIIDSEGCISHEVDLAIFDEQYTPYIFRNGQMKYIPIEAVSVVIQCKSTGISGVIEWAESIARLKTSFTGISRTATAILCGEMDYKDLNGDWIDRTTTQTATRPLRILCHMSSKRILTEERKAFDILIKPEGSRLKVELVSEPGKDTIADWINELNHNEPSFPIRNRAKINKKLQTRSMNELKVWEAEEEGNEIPLLTLTFQLNQLLMLINNPLLFPHRAYAEMFNRIELPFQPKPVTRRKKKGIHSS
ncbi:DUF6602 domain-containing protein [Paenibacillus glufosinatiresistens]|uniref:DUF6602 domain-containing protein n=1 Tax=Paenibacillus glufosinatiresistens TaxID=3070657 RepID=UPI00286D9398|nr:DUF6602 domain-containing protein [Paenibacillus sp. YX.27]